MSLLPPETKHALTAMLNNLMSPDNEVRSQAEALLNEHWIAGGENQLSQLLVGLAEASLSDENGTIRAFSAVIFRRVASKQPENTIDVTLRTIDVIPEEVNTKLKSLLLEGLINSQQTPEVRHKIADAVAGLAKPGSSSNLSAAAAWPQLIPALIHGSNQSDNTIRECCFRIFASVPEVIDGSIATQIAPIFEKALADPSDDVKIAALRAFTAYFRLLSKKQWPSLHPLLPSILNLLSHFLDGSKEHELAATFESIIELAELAPKMFKPTLKTILEFCISIAKNKDIDTNARLSALELLSTLADEAPNMCRNEPDFAPQVVQLCLQLMTEVGEDDDDNSSEWIAEDDINQSENNDEVYSAAKHSLDRLALKLGGEVILPSFSLWVPQLLESHNWKDRHAALMAFSNVAEGCAEIMIKQIPRILDMILPLIEDPHPRVQWAAVNALGQMSTDFADDMQLNYADRVVPALISKMGPSSVPRVQVHAAAAMVNFAENATKEILEPYLDSLLSNLLTLLQSTKTYVIEQVITTISIVADAAQTKFIKYYDTLMPMLFQFMKSDTNADLRTLKAKSIECSTLIVVAVGKEIAHPQFQEMVQIFATIQNSCTEEDDPCLSYLGQAWGRLCQVFGKEFLPYLGGVMPPLLATAKARADLQLIEDEKEMEQLELTEGWEILPLQGKYIGLHTAVLDEKAQAIDIINIYAGVLGEDFYSYVPEIVKDIVLPGLHFFYNDSVRYSTLFVIPSLLVSAQKAVMKGNNVSLDAAKRDPAIYELWHPIFEKLIDLLSLEPLMEVLVAAYTCLYIIIDKMYPGVLTEKQLQKLGAQIRDTMTKYNARAISRQEEDNTYTEDVDEDDSEEVDNELIGEVNKALHSIFKSSGAAFLPVFQSEIAPLVQTFLGGSLDQRDWALNAVDDLIEFTGPASWALKDLFVNHFSDALVNGSSSIRLAAAYGIGVAAQHGGDSYAAMCLHNLQSLFDIANAPDARSEENVEAAENACASIAKILRKYGGTRITDQELNQALVGWVKTLPVYNDDEAAPYAYMFLCDLVEQGHESVMDQIPKVLESVGLALQHDAIAGRTRQRVIDVFKAFMAKLPQDQLISLVQAFPQDIQKALHEAFQ